MKAQKISHPSVFGQIVSDAPEMCEHDHMKGVVLVQEEKTGIVHAALMNYNNVLPTGARVILNRDTYSNANVGLGSEICYVLPARSENLRDHSESLVSAETSSVHMLVA